MYTILHDIKEKTLNSISSKIQKTESTYTKGELVASAWRNCKTTLV